MQVHQLVRWRSLGLAVLCGLLPARPAAAQLVTYQACYVQHLGALYLIGQPGLATHCLAANPQITWTNDYGAIRTGTVAAGDLSGTYPNPTVARLQGTPVASTAPTSGQVLTYNGTAWAPAAATGSVTGAPSGDLGGTYPNPTVVRLQGTLSTTFGFAVTGTFGNLLIPSGTIPAGAGTRLMWYPVRSAFRAGSVDLDQWDIGSLGSYSTAFGFDTKASGSGSTAMGEFTTASGGSSTAMGNLSTASGDGSTAIGEAAFASGNFSTAMGNSTRASGFNSLAMGAATTASGESSTAMGYGTTASGANSTAIGFKASTNAQPGSFVYGDASSGGDVQNTAPNQFLVRAAGGFGFRTSPDLSTGCSLPAGSGSWDCTSSRLLKTHFETLDGETVLTRVRDLPVELWSYKAEPGVRHLGTFAEDFHRAFGLGPDATSIGSIDMDGVNLAGVKALEQRTRNLQEQLNAKDREITDLRHRLERLEAAQQ